LTTDDREQLHLRIPPEAKRAAQLDAIEKGSNLNDVLGQIICDHYDIPFESRSNRRSPFGGGRPSQPVA
jgi:hypothetical protein